MLIKTNPVPRIARFFSFSFLAKLMNAKTMLNVGKIIGKPSLSERPWRGISGRKVMKIIGNKIEATGFVSEIPIASVAKIKIAGIKTKILMIKEVIANFEFFIL